MTSSDMKKRYALAQILPLCSDSEITGFAIDILNDRDFPADSIQSLLRLKDSQMKNENDFAQRILRGENAILPSEEPVIAMADAQKRQMVEFSKSISHVQIDLVIDEESNQVKGYRFQIDDIPLNEWCQQNGLPFDVYQAGLQAYVEVDVLGPLDIAIINSQLLQMNTDGTEFEVISYDDFIKKLSSHSISWREELEKRMKHDHFIEGNGKVDFSIESLTQKAKKPKSQKTEESPNLGID